MATGSHLRRHFRSRHQQTAGTLTYRLDGTTDAAGNINDTRHVIAAHGAATE
jgi:hypothetical protein